jgi:UDP-N-acetylglucosamine 2-epimerase (non-hydrolysing)
VKKILVILGTRPEAIKFAPLILELKKEKSFETRVCVTGQHKTMLEQVLQFFDIKPDFDLALMRPDQTLFSISSGAITELEKVLNEYPCDLVFVQGDTTTAFIGALAAFYKKTKVAHLEAGLRSGNKYSPFPEEINRRLTGVIADFHFAPTQKARENLAAENISGHVYVVGNTVIDALLNGVEKLKSKPVNNVLLQRNNSHRMILITGHRRESFGEPFRQICQAIKTLAQQHPQLDFVYPVHLNPNVQKPVHELLDGLSNVHLVEPVDYPTMIQLMTDAHLILTDSGGIQEEAPSLGKPVLVMRDVTERTEGIDAGTAILVGTEADVIVKEVNRLLEDADLYRSMSTARNPYGDGTSSVQIVSILKNIL